MRRFASALVFKKKDDDGKKSWKSWIKRRPVVSPKDHNDHMNENEDADIDNDDDSANTTIPLDSLIPFTAQSLIAIPSIPPLAPDSLFPHSVNRPSGRQRSQSLRVHVLKSAILHQYQNHTGAEPLSKAVVSDFPNISSPPVSCSSSPGLRRWISRPCFEDRNVIYTHTESGILVSQISASLSVAAIEYSHYLEVMADPAVLKPATQVTVVPLPLSQKDELPPPSPSDSSDSPPPMTPTSPPTTIIKRVVRFAATNDQDSDDDDGDDAVPLYLIRQKKMREQKAKFLKQERSRKARQEEISRRERERDALEKEKEQARFDEQRIQAEKDRKQKEQTILAEQVVKARLRREQQRAGGVPALVMRDQENNLNLGVVPSSNSAIGERNRQYASNSSSTASLRGVPSSSMSNKTWRDSSVDLSRQPPLSDSSPDSSRPSSRHATYNSASSPSYQSHLNSRPPSSYSSSSESIGRRNSHMPLMGSPAIGMMSPLMNMVQMPSYFVPQPIIMNYPPFASSNPNVSYKASQAIPPSASFPNSFIEYNNLMPNDIDLQTPLLPPAAPFMKQPSYERRKSSERESVDRNSSSISLRSHADWRRDSVGSSSERVANIYETGIENQRISRAGKPSAPGDGSGARRPYSGKGHTTQQRSSSGPANSSNLGGQPTRASTIPVITQLPSPWTGIPTAQQRQLAQLANGASRNGTGGQSVSGASSSTVTKRGSVMSIGKSISKSRSKPSMKLNPGRSQTIAW